MSSAMREGCEIYFQIKLENGEKYRIPNSFCVSRPQTFHNYSIKKDYMIW